MFSLSDTPVANHSVADVGEYTRHQPTQSLPNVVEKKLEVQREHPKITLGLNCKKFPKSAWSGNALPRNCFFFEFNLFLQEKGYMPDTKFCKKLDNHSGFYVPKCSQSVRCFCATPEPRTHPYSSPWVQMFSL